MNVMAVSIGALHSSEFPVIPLNEHPYALYTASLYFKQRSLTLWVELYVTKEEEEEEEGREEEERRGGGRVDAKVEGSEVERGGEEGEGEERERERERGREEEREEEMGVKQ